MVPLLYLIVVIIKKEQPKANQHSNQGPPHQTPKALTTLPLLFWLFTLLNLCIISELKAQSCLIVEIYEIHTVDLYLKVVECSNRSSEKVIVLLEYLNAIHIY